MSPSTIDSFYGRCPQIRVLRLWASPNRSVTPIGYRIGRQFHPWRAGKFSIAELLGRVVPDAGELGKVVGLYLLYRWRYKYNQRTEMSLPS